jgi:hypothetical protein
MEAVTVCLAALAENGRSIVTACDTRLSWGTGGQHADKAHPVHRDWQFLYAADEISGSTRALEYLARTVDYSPKSHAEMIGLIEGSFLNTPPYDTGRMFLLAGFDDRGFPHLSIHHEDEKNGPVYVDRSGANYSAIGIGADQALLVLSQFGHRRTRTVAETLYSVCAAKFFAENASDVGRETQVYVLRQGETIFVPNAYLQDTYEIWQREGQLPLPLAGVLRGKALNL